MVLAVYNLNNSIEIESFKKFLDQSHTETDRCSLLSNSNKINSQNIKKLNNIFKAVFNKTGNLIQIGFSSMDDTRIDNFSIDLVTEVLNTMVDDNSTDTSHHFLISNEMLVTPIFIIFIVTGVFGNCLVCLAIYTNRYLKRVKLIIK